ncbi:MULTISPECIES: MFS transporter [unclassified Bradyrhizobium]
MQATQRLCFIGFSSASFFIVGVGIVLPAWIAFHAGGSSLVGLLLLTSSVAGFVLAPLSGYIVDRHSRLTVTASGQVIRALGLFMLALVQVLPDVLSGPILLSSAILGAVGYALLAGAVSGLLQSLVPETERMAFNLRLSVFNQAGLAIGTGVAGYFIDRLGSATTAALSACMALAILPLLARLTGATSGHVSMKSLNPLSASREALRYLLNEPQSLSAAVTAGLAFAVI